MKLLNLKALTDFNSRYQYPIYVYNSTVRGQTKLYWKVNCTLQNNYFTLKKLYLKVQNKTIFSYNNFDDNQNNPDMSNFWFKVQETF